MTSAIQNDSTRLGFGQTHKHTTAQQHRMEMLACRCAHDTDVTSTPYLCFKVNMDRTYSIFMLTYRKTRFDVRYWCQGMIWLVVSNSHCFYKFKCLIYYCFIFGFAFSVCIIVSALFFKKMCRCLHFCFYVCMHVVHCIDVWELRPNEVPLIFDQ